MGEQPGEGQERTSQVDGRAEAKILGTLSLAEGLQGKWDVLRKF